MRDFLNLMFISRICSQLIHPGALHHLPSYKKTHSQLIHPEALHYLPSYNGNTFNPGALSIQMLRFLVQLIPGAAIVIM